MRNLLRIRKKCTARRSKKAILLFAFTVIAFYFLSFFIWLILGPRSNKQKFRQTISVKPQALEKTKPSLGVCITGQLCRLELINKMNYFILPTLKEYNVHIHFLLQDWDCRYTNHQTQVQLNASTDNSFFSFSNVNDWLNMYMNQNQVESVDLPSALTTSFKKAEFGEPFLNYRYMYHLNKLGSVNETQRALNHWRQWSSYKGCLESLNLLKDFDLYARIREDLLFHNTFVPPQTWRNQSKYDMWLPKCASWGGSNDKVAFIHPRASESYFSRIIDVYENHFDDLECMSGTKSCKYIFMTKNPETFLQQALEFLKVRVQRLEPEDLPCLTGVYMGGSGFCFYQHQRQLGLNLGCLPTTDRQIFKPPCHEFNASSS